MCSHKATRLLAVLVCMSFIQACSAEKESGSAGGLFDGDWNGQYQTTWGQDCGGSTFNIYIGGRRVRGVARLIRTSGPVFLKGTIDAEGRMRFRGSIPKQFNYEFEGRFFDANGLRSTDPVEAGVGAKFKGSWKRFQRANTSSGATMYVPWCTGSWSLALQ